MDFKILKNIEYSNEGVTLGVNDHWDMFTVANELSLPSLKRVNDYYGENVTFYPEEFEHLLNEINIVISHGLPQKSTIELLNQLKELISKAAKDKKPIVVITE